LSGENSKKLEEKSINNFTVGKHKICTIGEYSSDNGKITKLSSSKWNAKVWIETVLKGRWEAKFKVHKLNESDKTGLIFGVWASGNERCD